MSSRRIFVWMSGRQSADWSIESWQWFLAWYLITKNNNWSRSRDARIFFVSTSNFKFPGTIIRLPDPRFQNWTQFWKAEGQLYKIHTKPENRLRHDPTLKYSFFLKQGSFPILAQVTLFKIRKKSQFSVKKVEVISCFAWFSMPKMQE